MKDIFVVGAAIIDHSNILCAQRANNRILSNLWEFPGGKIEPNESPQTALTREIKEELGADITVGPKVVTSSHTYDFGIIHLTVFYAKFTHAHFDLVAHNQLKWIPQSEIDTLTWAPADIEAMKIIKNANLSLIDFT
ncbi:(deoxy)nucleoside triphosphate pyrophosphohydrolase [Pediococcus argentinicus]|uniref:(deoxy)nucleoside triphosphate pyrophosphohydrolase n=1 Tax=Pediococcus argentinicus TaxID=480391 RepID=UPI00338D3FAC